MIKKNLFKLIPLLFLAVCLGIAGCSNPSSEDPPVPPDTSGLSSAISAAQTLLDATAVSIDGTDKPVNTFWVIQSVWDEFDNAITGAEGMVSSATNQGQVEAAKTALTNAQTKFNGLRRAGTKPLVNKTPLSDKISEAETAKAGVIKAESAEDAPAGVDYVSASVMETFNAAIAAANTAMSTVVENSEVTSAVNALETAITTFNDAKKSNGTKVDGFTLPQLQARTADAETLKGTTTVNTSADEVSPLLFWVIQNDMDTFQTKIDAANNAVDEGIEEGGELDTLYMELEDAIADFKGVRESGSPTEDAKTALTGKINAANAAKDGVVTAPTKDDAPLGAKWANTDQWSPFTASLDAALLLLGDDNAAKKPINDAETDLNTKTTTFSSDVNGNGLGLKGASVKITGMTDLNGREIAGLGLALAANENPKEDDAVIISKDSATVSGGTIELMLYDLTGAAWKGTGEYYIGFSVEPGLCWISKEMYDFDATPNPVLNFTTDMHRLGFSTTVGEFVHADESFPSSITLNALAQSMGDESYDSFIGMTSEEMAKELAVLAGVDFWFYKDKNLITKWKGTESVSADSKIYAALPWWDFMEDESDPPPGEPVGTISGQVNFTNVKSQGLEVWVSAGGGGSWFTQYSPTLEVSGNGIYTWEVPIYENYGFTPGDVYFQFRIYPKDLGTLNGGMEFNYYAEVDAQYNTSGGDLPTTIDCDYIELSGTMTADYSGQPLDKLYIYANNSAVPNISTTASYEPRTTTTQQWKMAYPKAGLTEGNNSIVFAVDGRRGESGYNRKENVYTEDNVTMNANKPNIDFSVSFP